MTRYLIVNADDLGHPAGTVKATRILFEAGVVTSASAMTNMPDWPHAAAMLRDHPEWDAGVHLVMNDGQPVLPAAEVATLIDDTGHFYDGRDLLIRFPLISRAQLRAEWTAQIDRFIAETGRSPSHLDLHCHYPYMFPAWFRTSVELAVAYGGLPIRMPFDKALEEKSGKLSDQYGIPPWFIVWQGRRYRKMVTQANLPGTDYWESDFSQDGQRTVPVLLEILERLPEGTTEILCHPGIEGWRIQDYQALIDPRVRQALEGSDIVLTDYRGLRERASAPSTTEQ
ncbi:MAG: ChbG/HpnK family deacetylase [Anaerolineae bacterium]|jgi:predicted glycoside hydrolase/deacetylase ChbG (UPF0249 family)